MTVCELEGRDEESPGPDIVQPVAPAVALQVMRVVLPFFTRAGVAVRVKVGGATVTIANAVAGLPDAGVQVKV